MRNFLVFTVLFAIAPPAIAQQYTGTVAYPITLPAGISGFTPGGPQSSVAGQTVGDGTSADTNNHALIWSAPNGSVTDLNPAGFPNGKIYATDGVHQVGYASINATTTVQSAMLWSGTAASAVNLNPTGFYNSIAYDVAGNQQVGAGYGTITLNFTHALLWSGTAASVVDLEPAGFYVSWAYGIAGNQQVGEGFNVSTGAYEALLWTGTAASAIDLNPTGFYESAAFGAGGNQQVGAAFNTANGNNRQAIVWSGTAASAVDLNPTNLSGFIASEADATNGAEQVGYGQVDAEDKMALLWSGTASSTVNLQLVLPSSGTWQQSLATSIDANGNVYGLAEGIFDGISGDFAVEWSPTPEPSVLYFLAASGFGLMSRQRISR